MSEVKPCQQPSDCWGWLPADEVIRHALAAYYAACRECEAPPAEPFMIDGSGYADQRTFRDELAQHFVFRLNAAALAAGVGAPMSALLSLPVGQAWPEHREQDADGDHGATASESERMRGDPARVGAGVAGGVGGIAPCEGQSPVYGSAGAVVDRSRASASDKASARPGGAGDGHPSPRPADPLFCGTATKELHPVQNGRNNALTGKGGLP